MDEPMPPRRGNALTLADVVAAEQAAVAAGAATACGKVCDDGCHGQLTCARAEHSHDPDADMGPGAPRGDVVPHAGYDPDGQLVQWTCLPGNHDGLTADERAARRVAEQEAARAEATRDLIDTVDPALLVQLLRDGGHL